MSTNETFDFHDEETPGYYMTTLYVDNTQVCTCKITIERNVWSIVSWYTNKAHMHNGYGYKTMKHIVSNLCAKYGRPDKIRYIWNGANEYVMEWMKRHFTPVSLLPLAVQKYSEKDEWEAHIYILDRNKFLEYFGIRYAESL